MCFHAEYNNVNLRETFISLAFIEIAFKFQLSFIYMIVCSAVISSLIKYFVWFRRFRASHLARLVIRCILSQ